MVVFLNKKFCRGKSQQPDHQFDIQRENTNGLGNKSFSSESELIVTAFSYQYEPATHM